ncbi:MAG: bifunctional (p)ppGpp synthetase/guanosine-3',5'-bis(diphosphate) 3'-pyrophosphohydrolase [Desulfuromonadales bacterium]|nr:bifunctional (p)ppGpp synthetase/guanosine-3',5'-bis(diphosphate) 3'-pyrophosphohydrolase [Desulfuromonadales bacterium]NIR34055.1 bifunctional (p)ppGpp synthetase/guanosine-3',5'-bis(diphosphate) 3'-pyrophosphohydrolase [Desulfuromonadales bacterium]NIS44106.1 bifunctional (p)ppGpp synthetase/guanosine-3',5'-bis(diphosphate) 3'-pyrophosphohydrolase [Desulfuromonadales bacterium]
MSESEDRKIQRMINEIMELLVTHYGGELSEDALDSGIDAVHRAINNARSSHSDQLRKSGEPYFFHPLRVAHQAARHWMDFSSIMAALLHDVVEDTPVTLEEVREDFGDEVALLVDGLTKVDDDKLSRAAMKTETYRKQLLLAMRDIRVLCLKFWDRLDNLRTIGALHPDKQSLIAEETVAVYVPLARHLGMGDVASELRGLSDRILYPRRSERYVHVFEMVREETEAFRRQMRARVHNALEHHKVPFKLIDRWRPFSLTAAKVMHRGLSTLYSLEIRVDHTLDAYLALGVLHGIYPPIPGKLRDHLSVTSPFGYQSLKTTVQAGEHRMRVEVTTRKLARFNDSGVLAPGFEFRKANFQALMGALVDGESAFDTESLRLASSSIQVYTPKGETRSLPEGSSALDLAFEIHEELGLYAVRARINGQSRQLKSRLMDGDQVEVERDKNAQVLPKWLDWAITPKARNSIRRYLRQRVKD